MTEDRSEEVSRDPFHTSVNVGSGLFYAASLFQWCQVPSSKLLELLSRKLAEVDNETGRLRLLQL